MKKPEILAVAAIFATLSFTSANYAAPRNAENIGTTGISESNIEREADAAQRRADSELSGQQNSAQRPIDDGQRAPAATPQTPAGAAAEAERDRATGRGAAVPDARDTSVEPTTRPEFRTEMPARSTESTFSEPGTSTSSLRRSGGSEMRTDRPARAERSERGRSVHRIAE